MPDRGYEAPRLDPNGGRGIAVLTVEQRHRSGLPVRWHGITSCIRNSTSVRHERWPGAEAAMIDDGEEIRGQIERLRLGDE